MGAVVLFTLQLRAPAETRSTHPSPRRAPADDRVGVGVGPEGEKFTPLHPRRFPPDLPLPVDPISRREARKRFPPIDFRGRSTTRQLSTLGQALSINSNDHAGPSRLPNPVHDYTDKGPREESASTARDFAAAKAAPPGFRHRPQNDTDFFFRRLPCFPPQRNKADDPSARSGRQGSAKQSAGKLRRAFSVRLAARRAAICPKFSGHQPRAGPTKPLKTDLSPKTNGNAPSNGGRASGTTNGDLLYTNWACGSTIPRSHILGNPSSTPSPPPSGWLGANGVKSRQKGFSGPFPRISAADLPGPPRGAVAPGKIPAQTQTRARCTGG